MSTSVTKILLISKSVNYNKTKLINFLENNSPLVSDIMNTKCYIVKTELGSLDVFVFNNIKQSKNYFIEYCGLEIDPDNFNGDYDIVFGIRDYRLSKKVNNLFDLLKEFFIEYEDQLKILVNRDHSFKFE